MPLQGDLENSNRSSSDTTVNNANREAHNYMTFYLTRQMSKCDK
jgi:hypothetical protein